MDLDKRTASRVTSIAPLLKVCGHPLRLKILCAIESGAEACVSELWACLEQSQPVVSQHLAVLKRRGVVSSRVVGNRRVYAIREPYIRNLVQELLSAAPEPAAARVSSRAVRS